MRSCILTMQSSEHTGPGSETVTGESYMTPLGALHVLILELFSVQEFRHWLRHGGYADIVPFLPGDSAIDADVVDQALRALARRARINEAFFRHLVNARPLQKAAVLSVAALWSKSKKPGPSHESPAPIGGDRRHTLIGGRDLSLRLPRGIFTGSFALVVIIAVAWALWRALHSEVAPARAGDPGIALNAVAPMKFVKIAGGRFKMGSPASERDRFIPDPSKELPYPSNLSAYFADESLRMVEVSPFEMAITEVTNSQWTAVMGTMPPSDCTYGCGPNHPVSLVTWVMAVEYLNKLTDLENLGISPTQHRTRCYRQQGIVWKWVRGCTGYRLPSEIEWEYAARAGTETAYGFGDDVKDLCKHANGADGRARNWENKTMWAKHRRCASDCE